MTDIQAPAARTGIGPIWLVVFAMTDNQGYGDLGAYGGLRAPTPHMDYANMTRDR